MTKEEALLNFLKENDYPETELDDIDQLYKNGGVFAAHSREYMVLNDVEAVATAAEYIKESIWAFNPEFLVRYMPEGVGVDVLKILQEKCEDCNEALKAMLGIKIIDLAQDAIACDGRGHFINHYDGEEYESGEYFIYRQN